MADFIPDRNRSFRAGDALNFPPIDPGAAAMLVDMVNWQVTRGAGMERDDVAVDYAVDRVSGVLVPNLQRLPSVCRGMGVKVVYLRVGCCQADFSDSIAPFRKVMSATGALDGSWACDVIDALRTEPGDISRLKTGSGGFLTSNLDRHLRNMGIRHVLYTGVITNGCVLLTLAAGFDLGYHGYLVADATATFSQRWQEAAEELVGVYLARIVTTQEIIDQLQAAKPPKIPAA